MLEREPWKPLDLTGDKKIEADIKAYKISVERKERMNNSLKESVVIQQPFDYSKQWKKHIKKCISENKKNEMIKMMEEL